MYIELVASLTKMSTKAKLQEYKCCREMPQPLQKPAKDSCLHMKANMAIVDTETVIQRCNRHEVREGSLFYGGMRWVV